MGHQHHGRLATLAQLAKQFVECLAEAPIETAGGLVQQQQPGLVHQHASERGALFLTAGKLRRFAAGELAELERLEQVGDAAMAVQSGISAACVRRKAQIFAHGHVRKQRVILKDVAAATLLRGKMQLGGSVEIEFVVY